MGLERGSHLGCTLRTAQAGRFGTMKSSSLVYSDSLPLAAFLAPQAPWRHKTGTGTNSHAELARALLKVPQVYMSVCLFNTYKELCNTTTDGRHAGRTAVTADEHL